MKPLKNGFLTGLLLQLALGPVFFYVINLALEKSLYNALMGVLAVTLVDTIFILFAFFGTVKLLEHKKSKIIFGVLSSIVLMLFGYIMIRANVNIDPKQIEILKGNTLLNSFLSTFFITIINPLTIVFFSGLFTTKAIENNYTRKDLYYFGLGTILATLFFMSSSVFIFLAIKSKIPLIIIYVSKKVVGTIIIGYGIIQLRSNIVKI